MTGLFWHLRIGMHGGLGEICGNPFGSRRAFRCSNGFECVTAIEDFPTEMRECGVQNNRSERLTAGKHRIAEGGHGFGQYNRFKCGTIKECAVSDGFERIGQYDSPECPVITECVRCDMRNSRRNRIIRLCSEGAVEERLMNQDICAVAAVGILECGTVEDFQTDFGQKAAVEPVNRTERLTVKECIITEFPDGFGKRQRYGCRVRQIQTVLSVSDCYDVDAVDLIREHDRERTFAIGSDRIEDDAVAAFIEMVDGIRQNDVTNVSDFTVHGAEIAVEVNPDSISDYLTARNYTPYSLTNTYTINPKKMDSYLVAREQLSDELLNELIDIAAGAVTGSSESIPLCSALILPHTSTVFTPPDNSYAGLYGIYSFFQVEHNVRAAFVCPVIAADGSLKSHELILSEPYATLVNEISGKPDAWKVHTRLSLGGTADTALEHYLQEHPNCRQVTLCLDHDEAGITAAKLIAQKLSPKGYTVRILPPKCKDYNEQLKAYSNPAGVMKR